MQVRVLVRLRREIVHVDGHSARIEDVWPRVLGVELECHVGHRVRPVVLVRRGQAAPGRVRQERCGAELLLEVAGIARARIEWQTRHRVVVADADRTLRAGRAGVVVAVAARAAAGGEAVGDDEAGVELTRMRDRLAGVGALILPAHPVERLPRRRAAVALGAVDQAEEPALVLGEVADGVEVVHRDVDPVVEQEVARAQRVEAVERVADRAVEAHVALAVVLEPVGEVLHLLGVGTGRAGAVDAARRLRVGVGRGPDLDQPHRLPVRSGVRGGREAAVCRRVHERRGGADEVARRVVIGRHVDMVVVGPAHDHRERRCRNATDLARGLRVGVVTADAEEAAAIGLPGLASGAVAGAGAAAIARVRQDAHAVVQAEVLAGARVADDVGRQVDVIVAGAVDRMIPRFPRVRVTGRAEIG